MNIQKNWRLKTKRFWWYFCINLSKLKWKFVWCANCVLIQTKNQQQLTILFCFDFHLCIKNCNSKAKPPMKIESRLHILRDRVIGKHPLCCWSVFIYYNFFCLFIHNFCGVNICVNFECRRIESQLNFVPACAGLAEFNEATQPTKTTVPNRVCLYCDSIIIFSRNFVEIKISRE